MEVRVLGGSAGAWLCFGQVRKMPACLWLYFRSITSMCVRGKTLDAGQDSLMRAQR